MDAGYKDFVSELNSLTSSLNFTSVQKENKQGAVDGTKLLAFEKLREQINTLDCPPSVKNTLKDKIITAKQEYQYKHDAKQSLEVLKDVADTAGVKLDINKEPEKKIEEEKKIVEEKETVKTESKSPPKSGMFESLVHLGKLAFGKAKDMSDIGSDESIKFNPKTSPKKDDKKVDGKK